MIISENKKPSLQEFADVMRATDELLNKEAIGRESYYKNRNGQPLEEDVYDAVIRSSKGTSFENSIQLVSGASFPDIVANKYYGIEVKSTKNNTWKSIGSSILESTRIQNVERIYITFGKLGSPVSFLSRPYEDCLSGISVTHYPRYQIDMKLKRGETIFDKMGISYDSLRIMENPVVPVSKYYRSKLKQGETLWWTDNGVEEPIPPTLRLWSTLSAEEKEDYLVRGYALFPEILGKKNTKYQNYALWLTKSCGIVNTNIRDQFSAGGKKTIYCVDMNYPDMPATFKRIANRVELIRRTIEEAEDITLIEHWKVKKLENNRISQWCKLCALEASSIGMDIKFVLRFLESLFIR